MTKAPVNDEQFVCLRCNAKAEEAKKVRGVPKLKFKVALTPVSTSSSGAAAQPAAAAVDPNKVSSIVGKLFTKLTAADKQQFFLLPVDENAFPNYREIVEKPMSLQVMQRKYQAGTYRHLFEIQDDAQLIVQNAKKFNLPGSVVHESALEFAESATKIFKSVSKKLQKYSTVWNWSREQAQAAPAKSASAVQSAPPLPVPPAASPAKSDVEKSKYVQYSRSDTSTPFYRYIRTPLSSGGNELSPVGGAAPSSSVWSLYSPKTDTSHSGIVQSFLYPAVDPFDTLRERQLHECDRDSVVGTQRTLTAEERIQHALSRATAQQKAQLRSVVDELRSGGKRKRGSDGDVVYSKMEDLPPCAPLRRPSALSYEEILAAKLVGVESAPLLSFVDTDTQQNTLPKEIQQQASRLVDLYLARHSLDVTADETEELAKSKKVAAEFRDEFARILDEHAAQVPPNRFCAPDRVKTAKDILSFTVFGGEASLL